MMTGGELVTQVLASHDVGTVFALGGASHTHLLSALVDAGVTVVSSRHESGAVGGADGYARATGKPGVALIVADQGLPNAVGALAVAWHACSPVVVLVATPPRAHVETDGSIDQDRLALVGGLSKWARTAPSAERLEDYLRTALRHAASGRPGPAVLLIPQQILHEEVPAPAPGRFPPASRPLADPAAIRAAADLIAAAERPMLVAGAGAAWGNASEPLGRLVERFGIPLLANGLGRGQVPEDGRTVLNWPYGQIAARHADVVIVVGARLTQRLGFGLPPRFAADARFIQIDIEASAFHRNRRTAVPIHADAGNALNALANELDTRIEVPFENKWLDEAVAPRAARIAEILAGDGAAIHPLELGAAIMQRLPGDAIVVGDGADIQAWMYGAIDIRRPRGFLDHYPMGAMGSGTALAVGAAAALAETHGDNAPPVVLITGDGSIGFHPAELHASARAGHRLIVIVGNDGAWGTEAHGQRQAIGRTINTELGMLPYEKLGQAFGARGLGIAGRGELDAVLDDAFAGSGPVLVNVCIDPEAGAELKTNPDVRMILFSDLLEGQADVNSLSADDAP